MIKEIFVLLAFAALCSACGCGCGCQCGGGQMSCNNNRGPDRNAGGDSGGRGDGREGGVEMERINIQANRDSLCKLGLKTHYIPDSAISASSYWEPQTNDEHNPKYGRLDQAYIPNVTKGSWSAAINNVDQWIQVSLNEATKITGVVTQGRDNLDQWVTQYKVSYLGTDQKWKYVTDAFGATAIFSANSDRDSQVTNMFDQPITAHKLRIVPTKWHGHISLRHEYLTC